MELISKRVLRCLVLSLLICAGLIACTSNESTSADQSLTNSSLTSTLLTNSSLSNNPSDVVVVTATQSASAQKLKALPPLPVSQQQSEQNSNEQQLDVGILIFESKEIADEASLQEQGVYPLVRKAESRYLPYLLRQTLEASSLWGVVRVMPDAHASAELVIEGEIQISNGEQLQIRVQAKDSRDKVWLNKVYRQNVGAAVYENTQVDPFQPLFDRLAADLRVIRVQLTAAQLDTIHQVAVLRYGQQLAPEAFNQYLQKNEEGEYVIQRLPARGDPMLTRVERLREYEYFFIDTVDEQYSNLFVEMKETYQRWRQYSRELMVYMRDYKARQVGKSSGFPRGSLASMNEVYGDYEWFRTQEANLSELAAGFNNEVLPTVLNLDDNVIKLDGNLQNQYGQWQGILKEIFQLERGDI